MLAGDHKHCFLHVCVYVYVHMCVYVHECVCIGNLVLLLSKNSTHIA